MTHVFHGHVWFPSDGDLWAQTLENSILTGDPVSNALYFAVLVFCAPIWEEASTQAPRCVLLKQYREASWNAYQTVFDRLHQVPVDVHVIKFVHVISHTCFGKKCSFSLSSFVWLPNHGYIIFSALSALSDFDCTAAGHVQRVCSSNADEVCANLSSHSTDIHCVCNGTL